MNRKPFLLLTLLLLFVLLVSTVAAQDSVSDREIEEMVVLERTVTPDGVNTVIQVPNFRDTFISSGQPDANFGEQTYMQIGYSLTGQQLGAMRMLLQYNVQDYVPSGAVINSATLYIYLTAVTPGGDSDMGFQALYLNSDWSEKTVTWNSHQPDWGSQIGVGSASSQLGWHQADVTPMVREWVDGGRKNFGFTLIGDEGQKDRWRRYTTKDAGSSYSSYMYVDYSVSSDTTPPVATVNQLPEWSPSSFKVYWEGYDPSNPDGSAGSGIRYYDIFDSTNNGSNWNTWRAQVTSTESNFDGGQHLVTYSFTARAKDNAGNEGAVGGVQAATKVDAQAPVVSVNDLPSVTTSPTFTISWGGTDSGSGIATYDVEWRVQGGEWQTLYQDTTLTSFTAQGAQDGVTYEFHARGTDYVGNHQAWTDVQASTTIALAPTSTITGTSPSPMLQIKGGPGAADSFQVYWQGHTAPGTEPLTYKVYYKPPNGGWSVWLPSTTQTTDTFVLAHGDPDGVYQFEVTARNNQGQQEDFNQTAEGTIMIDRNAPFIEQFLWMPIIFKEPSQN